jgi:hypothetical protein
MAKKKKKLPKGWITVRQAAALLNMTTGGVYAGIKKGQFGKRRYVDGLSTLKRADVLAYKRFIIQWLKDTDPNRKITDAEFVRRLWASDPD